MIGFNQLGQLGQLGNQMFQYASLMGIARKNNHSFTIPRHQQVITDAFGNCLRIELFDIFNLNPDKVSILNTDDNYYEKSFEFDESLYSQCPDNINLVGFFQSVKYFQDIENEVRHQFTFKSEYLDSYKEIESLFDNPIALHVRRGDYLLNSDNHYNLELKYYEKSLSQFDLDRQVIIFSDDVEWCNQQKLFSGNRFLISETKNSYVDLCIMSHCSDFIIANSTFSWWGAWLSPNSNKKVIYPSTWFGRNNAHKSTKDMFPSEWIML